MGNIQFYIHGSVLLCFQEPYRVLMLLAKSWLQGQLPTFSNKKFSRFQYICSDFEVSVSVAWEKIKGDNDAGRQEGGELWLQEGSAKAAAAKAAAAASTPELVSPLPSVVASQVEFIKHTLRAHNAHVRSLPFTFYSCLRIQLVLCHRCSGCRVTATERGSSAITACSAPNRVFIMYR